MMRGRLPQAGAAAMKIHEYQARALLADAGIPVPNAEMVTSVDEAIAASKRLLADADMVVVKAQVHAGGRGKAGFVTLCRSVDEVRDLLVYFSCILPSCSMKAANFRMDTPRHSLAFFGAQRTPLGFTRMRPTISPFSFLMRWS